MKKLLLLIAVLLLAGCNEQKLMVGVQDEPMYVDRLNGLIAVNRDGIYYYVLWDENKQSYIFDAVPYYRNSNMKKLPHSYIFRQKDYGK